MKKYVLLFTIIGLLVNNHVNGQYCGGSGPSVCTPAGGLTQEGFSPSDTALPCIVDGTPYNQVISLYAPATVDGYTLDSIHIVSITNIPCGLCWASGNANNTIIAGSAGCIRVTGTSNEAAGEYNVQVYATATVNLFGSAVTLGPLNADSALGLFYYLRVHIAGDTCVHADTIGGFGGTASTPGSIVTPNISGSTQVCSGGVGTTLTATGAAYYGYAWSNGSFDSTTTVTTPGTYTVTVYDNCNSATASVNVTLKTVNATITPGGATTFCHGDSVVLTSSAGSSYVWNTTATTKAITVKTSGSYTVTVTTAGGCTAASSATVVTVNQGPTANITAGGPTTFCQGGSVNLSVPPGNSYLWSNTATTASINVTATGSYSVTVTNTTTSCTAASAPTAVTVNPAPSTTVTPGGPTTFCQGGSVTLSAPAGYNYVWSNTETTQSISAAANGNYSVTVTNGTTSCSAVSSPTAVTVNANPSATITPGGPTTFCQGGSVTLSAPAGLSYSWSTTESTRSITASSTGNYSVTVTNTSTSCSAASTVTAVTVNPNPSAAITATGATSFCPGSSVTLSAPAGLGYMWTNLATSQSIIASQGGTYSVTVTDLTTSCTASSSTGVTVYPATNISAQPISQSTCIGGDVSFSVTGSGNNLSYLWYINGNSTGITASTYTVASAQISDTGQYVVVVTGTCGSDTSASASLSVSSSIQISQQPISQSVCAGSPVSFSVIANGSGTLYQWLLNGQTISDANGSVYSIASASISDTGTYTCQITSSCGDTTSSGAYLSVGATSASSIYDTICSGSSVNFNGQTYSAPGAYPDTLQNTGGCDSIVTLYLTVNPSYSAVLYDTVCAGNSFNFNGTAVDTSGTYQDTLIAVSGCDSIITLYLTVIPASISATSITICAGDSVYFAGQYLYTANTYSDTLNGSNTCDSIITLTLVVNNPAYTYDTAFICSGGSYNFNGVIEYQTGIYYDTLTGSNTCDSIVALVLTAYSPVYDTLQQAICPGDSFQFNGTYYSIAGNYNDTLVAFSTSCDSIVTLALTISQPVTVDTTVTICSGSSYLFNGIQLEAAGTYKDTVAGSITCDSITVLTLQLAAPTTLSWNLSSDTILNSSQTTQQFLIPAASPAGGTYSGPGVSGDSLTAESGSVTVTYTYTANGCTDSISQTFIIVTGINKIDLENAIRLYPNPVSESLVIESDLPEMSNVLPELYDLSGQVIAAPYVRQANRIIYNTGSLAPGMYFVKFNISSTVVSKRFVKID